MYYILVGSAVSIALDNPIYGVVVLMFMTEAEKLLKTIFGFDKARGGTVGGMAGAFTAGALASSVKDIARMAKLPQGGGKNGPSGNGGQGDVNMPKPTKNDIDPDDFMNGAGNDNPNQPDPTQPDPNQPNPNQPDPNQPDPNQPDPNQPDPNQPDPNQPDTNQPDPNQPDPNQPDPNQPDPNQPDPNQPDPNQPDPNQPDPEPARERSIRDLVKKAKKGLKSVGKKTIKPIWDTDKSAKYNGIRLVRKVGRVAAGVTVGTVAAATQAAISMADGKFSPFEAIGTFAAGYAGGGQISKSVEGIGNSFMEGTRSGDNHAQMEHANKV